MTVLGIKNNYSFIFWVLGKGGNRVDGNIENMRWSNASVWASALRAIRASICQGMSLYKGVSKRNGTHALQLIWVG